MSYTKPDQTQYASNLAPGEVVVILDTGDAVAVRIDGSVEPNTGNAAFKAYARAVMGDGSSRLDANGQHLCSSHGSSADQGFIAAVGGADAFKTLLIKTVLGDNPAWPNPLDETVLEHASIRSNLAAAVTAGPAQNLLSII